MPRTRRVYTPEFKAEAVKLVTEKGYSVAEAARSLGVHDTLLRSWKQAVDKQGGQAFPGHGKLPPFEEEIRRLHAELAARGHDCCVNTVAKLMRDHEIQAKTARKFRCTTDSDHDLPVAENLLDRQFDPEAPNEAWVADITYIPTGEGWLAHSDRGSQYASDHYQSLLARHGITCSMSRRADCWDNAPMESFFASLKKELVHHEDYATRGQARASLFEYIEVFYNRQRR